MKKLYTLSAILISSTIASASDNKIPGNSLYSTALANAYVANAKGADSNYHNPANMILGSSRSQYEIGMNYIYLEKLYYKSNISPTLDGTAQSENIFFPSFHYISKSYDKFRYGFSMVSPNGISKNWKGAISEITGDEVNLKSLEFNPSMAYQLNDKLSLAVGVSGIYGSLDMTNNSQKLYDLGLTSKNLYRKYEGKAFDFGYNLALSYTPNDISTLAFTYRSQRDIKFKGDATVVLNQTTTLKDTATVTLLTPPILNIAYGHKFNDFEIEVGYERIYWSKVTNVDFNYGATIGKALPALEKPILKNWVDTNTYKIGLIYHYDTSLDLMFGYNYNESPSPNSTYSFSSISNVAHFYSTGFEYHLDKKSSFGVGYLFADVKDRIVNKNINKIDGEITNFKGHIFNVAYKFSF